MTSSAIQDILEEVWKAKDSLSSRFGHDLKATCRALYTEQQKHPGDFVNLGAALQKSKVSRSATEH
ncbi:MAG: hypothetical protein WCH98_07100 [Verrucomicrobiota bacterium]